MQPLPSGHPSSLVLGRHEHGGHGEAAAAAAVASEASISPPLNATSRLAPPKRMWPRAVRGGGGGGGGVDVGADDEREADAAPSPSSVLRGTLQTPRWVSHRSSTNVLNHHKM